MLFDVNPELFEQEFYGFPLWQWLLGLLGVVTAILVIVVVWRRLTLPPSIDAIIDCISYYKCRCRVRNGVTEVVDADKSVVAIMELDNNKERIIRVPELDVTIHITPTDEISSYMWGETSVSARASQSHVRALLRCFSLEPVPAKDCE